MRSINDLRVSDTRDDNLGVNWMMHTFRNLEVTPNSTITDLIGLHHDAGADRQNNIDLGNSRVRELSIPLPIFYDDSLHTNLLFESIAGENKENINPLKLD